MFVGGGKRRHFVHPFEGGGRGESAFDALLHAQDGVDGVKAVVVVQGARVGGREDARLFGDGHGGGATCVNGQRGVVKLAAGEAQIALAFVLLVGAGLAVRTFINLLRIDPGFNPQNVLAVWIELPDYDYKRTAAFQDELLSQSRRLPGER